MLESIWFLPLLFATGLTAGLVDSIAGGGGLLTLPVLLGIGLPPHAALGTNKFQSSFGSFTSTMYYRRHNVVSIREGFVGVVFTAIGTVIGAWLVQQVASDFLGHLIPWLLFGIAVYTLFSPKFSDKDSHSRMSKNVFFIAFGLFFGFYDGFFGPGVGSFWAFAFVILLGFNLRKATGFTKLMNFTSNIVSVIMFLIGGNVWFLISLVMGAGQIIGSIIGAHLVIRKGAKLIRPVFITIVILTTLKLLYQNYF
jgi:uncharacterized protein